MNIKEIKEIVGLMNDNDIREFLIEREGFKLCIKKGFEPGKTEIVTQPLVQVASPAAASPPPVPEAAGKEEEKEANYIISPMVGTFYSAPSPESPPYVEVGQEVGEDTVVCIIEAMKVMNEIKAEKRGKILEVFAETGEPVEFGRKLFRIG
jgi:acetyl-CoA carboxylase biotin carboxyl carrier protein